MLMPVVIKSANNFLSYPAASEDGQILSHYNQLRRWFGMITCY